MEAIGEEVQVKMQYFSVHSQQKKNYTIHPYRLMYFRGGIYLFAFVKEYSQIRTFAVERIEALEAVDDGLDRRVDKEQAKHHERGRQAELRGAAAVLHAVLPAPDAEESWALDVAGRTVEVRTRGADRWVDATMDQGVPQLGPAIAGEQVQAYRAALNLAGGQLHPALPLQVVSTGLPYLIVPVQAGLERARISHPGFEGLLGASGAKFVYVLDPDRPEGRTWDNAGRVEDVATGSAAGPAAGYLLHHGVRPAGEPGRLPSRL